MKKIHSFYMNESGYSYTDKENKESSHLNSKLILKYLKRESFKTENVKHNVPVKCFRWEDCIDIYERTDGEYTWTDEDIFYYEHLIFDMDRDFIIKARDSFSKEEIYEEYKKRINRYVSNIKNGPMYFVKNLTEDLFFGVIDSDGNEKKIFYKDVFDTADEVCKAITVE